MKYDIALHEIMRIDEYADEDGKTKAEDNTAPSHAVVKDGELAATATDEAPTMSESPSSIDIPAETVINYDEPPVIAEEHPVVASPADTSAEPIAASDELAAIAPEDTSAAAPIAIDEAAAMKPAETSGAEPELKIDEAAATKSVDIATTESAIDPGESLTDPADLSTTEEAISAVKSTTHAAKDNVTNAIESTTDSAKETANNAVETAESIADSAKETVNDAVEAVKSTTDAAKENVLNAVESTTDAAQETWDTVQAKAPGIFDEITSAVPAFFQQNRQLLINLGVVFLAFVAAKLAFAGLNAIDDIPLVTPLLKIVGLVYVVKFIWNYLIREQDRENLVAKFNKTKAEILGDR